MAIGVKRSTKKSADVVETALPVVEEVKEALKEEPVIVVDNRVLPDSNLPTEYVQGVTNIASQGSGLLRPKFSPSENDIYISSSQIRRFNLRNGDLVGGQGRRPKENERYLGLLKVETVSGTDIEKLGIRPDFETMTAIYPDKQIVLY